MVPAAKAAKRLLTWQQAVAADQPPLARMLRAVALLRSVAQRPAEQVES
jgi:hypothetical protein